MAVNSIARPAGSLAFTREALVWIEGIEEQLADILACAHGALSHLESQDEDERDSTAYGILRVIKERAESAGCLNPLRDLLASFAEMEAAS
jgi:hypothetical protein